MKELLAGQRLVPVLTIHDVGYAPQLAASLLAAGIGSIEVALRSPVALAAITAIREAVPGVKVGAGTIRSPADVRAAVNAGASFLVTPATPRDLADELRQWDLPVLPAAATPTEVLGLLQAGFSCQKLFPAAQLGGTGFLKALAGPMPEVSFCPSGGINADNCRDYLATTNVFAVSGTWLTPTALIEAGDWSGLTRHVEHCLQAIA